MISTLPSLTIMITISYKKIINFIAKKKLTLIIVINKILLIIINTLYGLIEAVTCNYD